jgi:hypothetical protein
MKRTIQITILSFEKIKQNKTTPRSLCFHLCIWVGASLEEQPHDLESSERARDKERRFARRVDRVHRRPASEQRRHSAEQRKTK